MTNNPYVPYSFALKLKELGFKERVLTYYENEVPKLHNNMSGWDFNTSFLSCVSRPTYSQAFLFLATLQDDFKISIDENGFYIYNLENELYSSTEGLEKIIEVVEKSKLIKK